MFSTLEVALCVVIEHQNGPIDKVTLLVALQDPLESRFHMYDTY